MIGVLEYLSVRITLRRVRRRRLAAESTRGSQGGEPDRRGVCRTLAATGRRFNVGVLPVSEIKTAARAISPPFGYGLSTGSRSGLEVKQVPQVADGR